MDAATIGAALALLQQAAAKANEAAETASQAAQAANSAAAAANAAATAAQQYAAQIATLTKDAVIDREAFGMAYTMTQAELRDTRKRLTTTEAQLAALK